MPLFYGKEMIKIKNLSRQDRHASRTSEELRRRYRLNDIDYTKEEIQKLKMQIITDDYLSATSTNPVQNKVVTNALNNKVNKETGKGLSTNDFTDELLDKLNNMEATGDTLPIGAVIEWDSDVIPENWLLLDGQAVSRTEYSELFKLYGTRYGAGNGSTTFNLPNRKTRVAVGKDSTDSDFTTLGKTGGEKAHELTISEIPRHRHGIFNYNANGSELTESSSIMLGQTATGWSGNGFTTYEGGGAAHNNLQPYFVTNFIVKAKQSAGVIANVVDNLTSESSTDALSAKQGKVLNERITGTVLYQDATGTTGNITLDTAIENFNYFVVESYVIYNGAKVYTTTGKLPSSSAGRIHLNNQFIGANNKLDVYCKRIAIVGTSLTVNSDRLNTIIPGSITGEEGTYTYITKITGYEEAT